MKLTVTPLVVVGICRGGEDLFLVFEAKGQNEPWLDEEIEVVFNEDKWDEVNGDRAHHSSGEYQIEWSGTKENALALVADRLKNPENWSWGGPVSSEPVPTFQYKHFVGSNAD